MAAAIITLLEKWKVGKHSTHARESVVDCVDILAAYEKKYVTSLLLSPLLTVARFFRWIGAGKLNDVVRELLYLDDLVSHSGNSPGSSGSSNSPHSGSRPTMQVRVEDIFNMAQDAFPTVDLDFLGRSFVDSDDPGFAMLF